MDGLLVDSMIHWLEMDKKWFTKRDIPLTPDIIKQFTGKSIYENMNYLKDEFNLTEAVEELVDGRRGWEHHIYGVQTQMMPGADNLLRTVKSRQIKQAIASGAPLTSIEIVVDRFGWRDLFNELISADHVRHVGKPDPAIFLHTAEKLGIGPKDCVVFEDAENGVVAARCAGMKCVAVPDERWSFGDFSQADLIVDSLEDTRVFDYLDL